MKNLVFIITLALLAGCSSLPETLKPQTADAIVLDYQQWQQQPESKNVEVLAGGVIANVTNLDNQSRIEVVNLPLSSSGRPALSRTPQGRFVAYIQGFIDPLTYAKGKYITLSGLTNGTEVSKIGEFNYTFPVMTVHGQYLWTLETNTYIETDYWLRSPCVYGGRSRGCIGFYPGFIMRPPIVHRYTELN